MKKIIIFCHASLKEEQFCYFAYFATLRNTCCYLTLEEGCVFIILRTPLRICAWVDEMTSGAYQKHFFQWNFANTIEKITNYDNSRKTGFPSYDVKIVGGKKVIIYHDKQKNNSSLQKADER